MKKEGECKRVSEKIKPMLLIGKILVIIALPILFFSYIGQNPMKKTETASREIAIVNEDLNMSGMW